MHQTNQLPKGFTKKDIRDNQEQVIRNKGITEPTQEQEDCAECHERLTKDEQKYKDPEYPTCSRCDYRLYK